MHGPIHQEDISLETSVPDNTIQQTRVDHTFVFKLLNLDPKARPAMVPPLHEVKYYPAIK